MIPIKLTIQGLYSYQEKQTIDFRRLTSAHLFGIFGAVGSGKSSIIEAITYALYGETDRLNSRDSRNYNMMNLKSAELLIDFEFETGKEQTGYRAIVRGRRNSKRFEDVNALERTAYQQTNGEWMPIEVKQLEEIIGLSYSNFKRTIIIPQGQFQEFLQLGNADRTRMMKDIFHLEKFELDSQTAALESKNNAKKQSIEGQLLQLGNIDPAMQETYQKQSAELGAEIESLGKELKALQQQETQWEKLLETSEKFSAVQKQLEKLHLEETRFNQLETNITRYEQCHILFKSLLDALKVSSKKIGEKTEQIVKESDQLKALKSKILYEETLLPELKQKYENREQLRSKAGELDLLGRIQALKQQLISDKNRLVKGLEVQTQTAIRIETQKKEKEDCDRTIKEEKAKLPDLSVLSQAKAWHIENKFNIRQINDLNSETGKIEKEYDLLIDELKKLLAQPGFEGKEPGSDFQQAIRFLNDKTELNKKKRSAVEEEADHLRVQLKLETYAGSLHENEPCPLCGSLHHPVIFSAASVGETLNQLAGQKQKIDQQNVQIAETITQLNELSGRIKLNRKQATDQQNKGKTLQQKAVEHQSKFVWPAYEQETTVVRAFETADKLQKSIKEKETSFDYLSKKIEELQVNKERYQIEIDKIKSALLSGETEMKTIQQQLKFPELQIFQDKNALEITSEKQSLLKQYAEIDKKYNELTARLNSLREMKNTLTGSLQSNQSELKNEQATHSKLEEEIHQKLQQNEYALDEVKFILNQEIDLNKEKARLSKFRQEIAFVQNQNTQLKLEMGDRTYDPEAYKKAKDLAEQTARKLAGENQELGKTQELLKKLKQDLESKAQLQKDFEQLELRAENLSTLRKLFKAGGFVNYISSVYLQNLCNAANERFFQLTRQKLSLEITADNNFQVRDYLNGGKVRSVKTLSGGQTFQAALCLALALADNIQKITESNQNFFFLDEGFGSLDKDSLTIVFDTLKSLRKENRIVGVISHVEEMQQEIDTHLRIVNHEETGSQILPSWN
jgi:DNA repair protein SbcC/Rad50